MDYGFRWLITVIYYIKVHSFLFTLFFIDCIFIVILELILNFNNKYINELSICVLLMFSSTNIKNKNKKNNQDIVHEKRNNNLKTEIWNMYQHLISFW